MKNLIGHPRTLLIGLAATGAAFAVRSVLRAGWRATTDDDPPLNPASLDTAWGEAITWTLAAGITASLARLLVRRGLASYFDT